MSTTPPTRPVEASQGERGLHIALLNTVDEATHSHDSRTDSGNRDTRNGAAEVSVAGLSLSDSTGVLTPKEQNEVIDPHGDLLFTFTSGIDEHTWQVNSACIRLASSVWAQQLHALSPAKNKELQELHIVSPDVSSRVIGWALHAAHCRHSELPLCIAFSQLVQVADACERYALYEVLQPYFKKWADRWLPHLGKPGYELWLLVAYNLGYVDIFEHLTLEMALQIYVSDGEYFIGGFKLRGSKLEGRVLDNLLRVRNEYLECCVSLFNQFIDSYLRDQLACDSPTHASECTALALRSLLKELNALDIWPKRTQAEEICRSVNDLRSTLVQKLQYGYRGHNAFHECTGPWILEDLYLPCTYEGIAVIKGNSELYSQLHKRHADDEEEPLVWGYGACARLGFVERDFLAYEDAEDDLGQDVDGDYEWEDESSEPGEEYLVHREFIADDEPVYECSSDLETSETPRDTPQPFSFQTSPLRHQGSPLRRCSIGSGFDRAHCSTTSSLVGGTESEQKN